MMVYKKWVTLLLLLSNTASQAAFFKEQAEGWHWYQDPPADSLPEKIEPTPNPSSSPVSKRTPTETVKAYQIELEKKLHQAWVNPTEENVKSYQEMQRDLTQRSQNFSDTWMEVIYKNPHLDHTLVSPVNQQSRHLYLDQEKEKIAEIISNLREDYGLFFFFSSQCDYCHQFAPIVQQFSKNYGWEVISISVDGGTIPGFTETVMNNGLLEQWQVKVLPALFAVNPKTGDVLPVAYGLTALDQIETRIVTLLKNKR